MCSLLLCVPLYVSSEEEEEVPLHQQQQWWQMVAKEEYQEGEVAIESKDLFVFELLL